YTINVTNFGPSAASSVIVTDALPVGVTFVNASGNGVNNSGMVTWNVGTLIANATTNLTLTVQVPASGSITNVATVGSPTADPNPTNSVSPPVPTSIIPVADLAVGKNGPAGVSFNTTFSYIISVTNFGPSASGGITVTDDLPPGLAYVSSSPVAATNTGQVIWSLGGLAAGGTTNLTLDVTSTVIATVTNVAFLGSPTFDPVPGNN